MALSHGRRGGRHQTRKPAHAQKRKREDVDIEQLNKAVQDLNPKDSFDKFSALPLSSPTQTGLSNGHYAQPTEIQKRAIPLALRGRDILGAAQTGSGKTLAFLIPILENLYRAQHIGPDAGLGAMIISPTRELAIQIFDVLRNIGKYGHIFAAGLVIGGKSLVEEREALARMNIVVCTPGRMLQHLSQTAMFSVDTLRMLVLDEADRIMDMGFQRDVDAIIEYLPPAGERQTLLFSATQTKRVSDLARLSLKDPEYISVHESSNHATPSSLEQSYTITPLPEKLSTLWSFLQSAKKSKHLVFLSSGKQVRHVYESFRHLQPGIPLLHLHGRQKQTARLEITQRFREARHVCLFATDVAARGLDFPAVDWVVQVDCPEDADTYIHRVGRTARYSRAGHAVLFVDPAEEAGMVSRLAAKKVPIERIGVRAKKQKPIQNAMQGLCFKFPELKYLGQKAFVSYVRSLHVQKDREIFPSLEKYDLEGYAASMGLPGAPRIKFTRGDAEAAKKAKNAPRRGMSPEPDESGGEGQAKTKDVRTKYDRMFERRNQDVLAPHYAKLVNGDEADEKDNVPSSALETSSAMPATGTDDLFAVKSRFRPSASPEPAGASNERGDQAKPQFDSKRKQKALRTKAGAAKLLHSGTPGSTRLVFDDETGEARPPQAYIEETEQDREAAERARARDAYREKERRDLGEKDIADKVEAKRKRREKRDKRKAREREETGRSEVGLGSEDEGGGVELEVQERPFDDLADLYSSEDGESAGKDSSAPGLMPTSDGMDGEQVSELADGGRGGKRRRTSAKHGDEEHDDSADLGELEHAALGLLG